MKYRKLIILVLIILVAGFALYLYENTSSKVKERCYKQASSAIATWASEADRQAYIEKYYQDCLIKHNLN